MRVRFSPPAPKKEKKNLEFSNSFHIFITNKNNKKWNIVNRISLVLKHLGWIVRRWKILDWKGLQCDICLKKHIKTQSEPNPKDWVFLFFDILESKWIFSSVGRAFGWSPNCPSSNLGGSTIISWGRGVRLISSALDAEARGFESHSHDKMTL